MEDTNIQGINVSLSLPDLKNLIGWATFRAVMDIIVGALSCLGIITAAYGVPQIMGGVKLLNACDEMKRYMATNDLEKLNTTFISFNKFFKLTGISTIVKIIFGVVFFILYIVFIAIFFKTIMNNPDFMKNFPRY